MNTKLFVCDFGPQADIFRLEDLFSNFGTVRSAKLGEQAMARSVRQVAYIEMSSAEEARACIAHFHGMKLDGSPLTVIPDKPHVPDPQFREKRIAALAAQKNATMTRPKKQKPRRSPDLPSRNKTTQVSVHCSRESH